MMADHFALMAMGFAQHAARGEEPLLILQEITKFLFKCAAPQKIGFRAVFLKKESTVFPNQE